jgi:hypothetical protein
MVLLRIGRQRFEPMTVRHALMALSVERHGLVALMGWALDDRQDDPGRLREALDAYRDLPEPVDPELVAASEQMLAEQTLAMPGERLRDELVRVQRQGGPSHPDSVNQAWARLVTTPWELERARRVLGIFHQKRGEAIHERFRGPGPSGDDVDALLDASPLARELDFTFAATLDLEARAEVDRRALTQILALRIWQLEHDGRLPERLEALVPSVLDRLPDDPYAPGRPFGYVPSSGQELPVAGAIDWQTGAFNQPPRDTTGDRILYSIGPDLLDDRGTVYRLGFGNLTGDIVYPIPDAPPPDDD